MKLIIYVLKVKHIVSSVVKYFDFLVKINWNYCIS